MSNSISHQSFPVLQIFPKAKISSIIDWISPNCCTFRSEDREKYEIYHGVVYDEPYHKFDHRDFTSQIYLKSALNSNLFVAGKFSYCVSSVTSYAIRAVGRLINSNNLVNSADTAELAMGLLSFALVSLISAPVSFLIAAPLSAIYYANKNASQSSKLHMAIIKGDLIKLKLLVDSGADVNVKDIDGNTPLHLAAMRAEAEFTKVLISSPQLNLNAQNNCGQTALHIATKERHLNIGKILMSKNPDFSIENNDRLRPADYITNITSVIQHYDLRTGTWVPSPLEVDTNPVKREMLELYLEANVVSEEFKDFIDKYSTSTLVKVAIKTAKERIQHDLYTVTLLSVDNKNNTSEKVEELKPNIDDFGNVSQNILEYAFG